MYNLSLRIIDARDRFDKKYKYIIGDKMMDIAMDCLTLIHFANEDRRHGMRAEHLNMFLIKFDVLKTYIMVCRDRAQFKTAALLADIFQLTADVEKQLTGWRRSARGTESQSPTAKRVGESN